MQQQAMQQHRTEPREQSRATSYQEILPCVRVPEKQKQENAQHKGLLPQKWKRQIHKQPLSPQ